MNKLIFYKVTHFQQYTNDYITIICIKVNIKNAQKNGAMNKGFQANRQLFGIESLDKKRHLLEASTFEKVWISIFYIR